MKTLRFTILLMVFWTKICAQQNAWTIHWQPDYKLKWEDFQGNLEHLRGVAETSCSFFYHEQYTDTGIYFVTDCIFYKKKSRANTMEIDEYVLAHEQLHFDICEIYSRKLFYELRNVSLNKLNVMDNARRIYDELKKQWIEFEELYDGETLHGTDFVKQEEWNKKILDMLGK